jgi:hypothetical protein
MQKSWKSSGSSLALVLAVAVQGCGGSDIPALDSEDAALKGGIPASENGRGRRLDGVAGANGSGSVDDADDNVDAGVMDRCAPRAKGASSMHANNQAKEKSGMADTAAKGRSGECHGAKGGGAAVGKGMAEERGKSGDKASGADAAADADDDADEDQAQDENSDN